MKMTALIEREGDGYVSLCPELDIASQGDTTRKNLKTKSSSVEEVIESLSNHPERGSHPKELSALGIRE